MIADQHPRAPVGPTISPAVEPEQLILLGRIGGRQFALPAASVSRVLRMAALAPLVDARAGVVGVLNLYGSIFPVVDPRPRLNFPTPRFDPDQRLILSAGRPTYLLWLDRVDRIILAHARDVLAVSNDSDGYHALTPLVLCLDGDVIPILSLDALNPGALFQSASGSSQ